MTLQEYTDNIKLKLTGGVLHLEISDDVIAKIIESSLREIQRYIDTTKVITIPFAKCIDLGTYKDAEGNEQDFNCSSVVKVYRTKAFLASENDISESSSADLDPFQTQMWRVFSNNGNMYNLQEYILNYMSYNTLNQMRSYSSTDLTFKEVNNKKDGHKLYINVMYNNPTAITIEYIPKLITVDDVVSDYWIDILERLALAQVKVLLGRIRTRYTQSSALFTQDGETMLSEGNEELKELREVLRTNSQLFYPID